MGVAAGRRRFPRVANVASANGERRLRLNEGRGPEWRDAGEDRVYYLARLIEERVPRGIELGLAQLLYEEVLPMAGEIGERMGRRGEVVREYPSRLWPPGVGEEAGAIGRVVGGIGRGLGQAVNALAPLLMVPDEMWREMIRAIPGEYEFGEGRPTG